MKKIVKTLVIFGFVVSTSGAIFKAIGLDKQIEVIEFDSNGDGKSDTHIYMKDGRFLRKEIDYNCDGMTDHWYSYQEGIQIKDEIDSNGDGQADTVVASFDIKMFDKETILYAIEQLDNLYAASPNDYDFLAKKGELYLKSGEQERAKEILEEAYNKAPFNKSVLIAFVKLSYAYGDMKTTERKLNEFIKINSLDSKSYNMLGYLYHIKGKFNEAISYYEKALDIDSRNSRAKFNLAMAKRKTFSEEICREEVIVIKGRKVPHTICEVKHFFPWNPFAELGD